MSVEILNLDKDQLKFLLKNHECFTKKEVKIAAKLLVRDKFKVTLSPNPYWITTDQQRQQATSGISYGSSRELQRLHGGLFG